MEISPVYIIFALLIVSWAIKFFEKFWLGPKRLERALRAQGLKGNPYRFPFGDAKQFVELNKEALAKPIPLSHDIITRVAPHFHQLMTQHGKISFTWFLQKPTVILNDPESVRYVLTKQQHIFLKPEPDAAAKLLVTGLLEHQGEKWTKHRRIINPEFKAFTGDVISRTAFGSSFEEGRRIFELQQELSKLVVEASLHSYIPFYK